MVDDDDARAAGGTDDIAQRRLAVLDRTVAQIVAVEVEEVEGEIGELVGPALAQRLAELVDMGDAALVRHRDLAVEHQGGQPSQPLERFAEQMDAVVPVAADQLEVAVRDDRQQPVPVMLDLVQPPLAVRRLGAVRDDLEQDAVRYLGPHRR